MVNAGLNGERSLNGERCVHACGAGRPACRKAQFYSVLAHFTGSDGTIASARGGAGAAIVRILGK
jgi:hypothetical protein